MDTIFPSLLRTLPLQIKANANATRRYRDLGEVVKSTEKNTILLDCVTVMITNILCEDEERDFDKISASEVEKLESEVIKELSNLVKAIRDEDKTLIIVSNEVGMSVVPSYRLGRIFSDISGKANQVLSYHHRLESLSQDKEHCAFHIPLPSALRSRSFHFGCRR